MTLVTKIGIGVVGVVAFLIVVGSFAPSAPNVSPSGTPKVSASPAVKPEEKAVQSSAESYSVVKVVDGDTIDVRIGTKVERIRIIGLDTPETVDPRKPVQCFGIAASNKAKELLVSKVVSLESDAASGERDKYDRLLRYVVLADGTNFSKYMISQGYGHEYTYNSIPYKYQVEFKQAEKEAESAKRGLWADNACAVQSVAPKITPSSTFIPLATSVPISKSSSNASCSSDAYNCSAFKTCSEVMTVFNACPTDVNKLDADSDGIPCESLCR